MKTSRQFTRAAGRVRIEVNGAPGTTTDLSEGGFCASIRAPVKPGSTVYGRVLLGDQKFDYTGRVIWSATAPETGERRLGIRFLGVEHAYFEALAHAQRGA